MSKYANHIVKVFGRPLAQKPHGNANTLLHLKSQMNNTHNFREMSIRAKKRFYKEVSLVDAGSGNYEILLDSKKLKTPGGAIFTVDSEPLALAVAHEWESQKDQVILSQMHLTGLCNTAIDNPTQATKFDLVDNILNFLETDTILFYSDDQENLYKRQIAEWQPIIEWFNNKHEVSLSPSTSIWLLPKESSEAKEVVRRYLLSYNFEAVHGFTFGIDAIKSLLLMTAIADKKINVEEAVKLSRLEVDYQVEHWGNVEWAHDIELHDTIARVAAADIFIQCNSSKQLTRQKSVL